MNRDLFDRGHGTWNYISLALASGEPTCREHHSASSGLSALKLPSWGISEPPSRSYLIHAVF